MNESGWFNKFADESADFAASPWFFVFVVLSVVLWAPLIWVPRMDGDTWQLIINTFTTVVTYILVALLHNSQHRFEKVVDARLAELIRVIDGAKEPDVDG